MANTFNIAADLAAMGEALSLVIGGLNHEHALIFAAVSVLLQVFARYRRYAGESEIERIALDTTLGMAFSNIIADGSPTPEAVLGTISLIIWSLILVVSLKYAILILRADNRGEGGIVALLALLRARRARSGTWRNSILVLGLVGAALLYGDGGITPAISVLSAVEGLKVDAPALAPVVLPITLAILVGLFIVQRRGTDFIGGIFGPIMLAQYGLSFSDRAKVNGAKLRRIESPGPRPARGWCRDASTPIFRGRRRTCS
jgi:hypothetical protein